MIGKRIRDKSLDWFEEFMESRLLKRATWGAMVFAVLYFSCFLAGRMVG